MSKYTATISFKDLNTIKGVLGPDVDLVSITENKPAPTAVTTFTVKNRSFDGHLVHLKTHRSRPQIDVAATLKANRVTEGEIMGTSWPLGTWQHSLKRAIAAYQRYA